MSAKCRCAKRPSARPKRLKPSANRKTSSAPRRPSTTARPRKAQATAAILTMQCAPRTKPASAERPSSAKNMLHTAAKTATPPSPSSLPMMPRKTSSSNPSSRPVDPPALAGRSQATSNSSLHNQCNNNSSNSPLQSRHPSPSGPSAASVPCIRPRRILAQSAHRGQSRRPPCLVCCLCDRQSSPTHALHRSRPSAQQSSGHRPRSDSATTAAITAMAAAPRSRSARDPPVCCSETISSLHRPMTGSRSTRTIAPGARGGKRRSGCIARKRPAEPAQAAEAARAATGMPTTAHRCAARHQRTGSIAHILHWGSPPPPPPHQAQREAQSPSKHRPATCPISDQAPISMPSRHPAPVAPWATMRVQTVRGNPEAAAVGRQAARAAIHRARQADSQCSLITKATRTMSPRTQRISSTTTCNHAQPRAAGRSRRADPVSVRPRRHMLEMQNTSRRHTLADLRSRGPCRTVLTMRAFAASSSRQMQ
eukprot:comp22188_c0_seq2/m.52270 comp22188_c0_seq2/g.52270  ORF comp22188_c0_seq2/g.52270 comp22188_c0_seq2/m.52270 type:complete len:481 (+) comp22188_c0_seq2:355-1797(+)